MQSISDDEVRGRLEAGESFIIVITVGVCEPSKALIPILDTLQAKLPMYHYNLDYYREIAKEFRVNATPAFLRFFKGRIIDMKFGLVPKEPLDLWLQAI